MIAAYVKNEENFLRRGRIEWIGENGDFGVLWEGWTELSSLGKRRWSFWEDLGKHTSTRTHVAGCEEVLHTISIFWRFGSRSILRPYLVEWRLVTMIRLFVSLEEKLSVICKMHSSSVDVWERLPFPGEFCLVRNMSISSCLLYILCSEYGKAFHRLTGVVAKNWGNLVDCVDWMNKISFQGSDWLRKNGTIRMKASQLIPREGTNIARPVQIMLVLLGECSSSLIFRPVSCRMFVPTSSAGPKRCLCKKLSFSRSLLGRCLESSSWFVENLCVEQLEWFVLSHELSLTSLWTFYIEGECRYPALLVYKGSASSRMQTFSLWKERQGHPFSSSFRFKKRETSGNADGTRDSWRSRKVWEINLGHSCWSCLYFRDWWCWLDFCMVRK